MSDPHHEASHTPAAHEPHERGDYAHAEHGHGVHDEHGAGHGHGADHGHGGQGEWIDYNAKAPAPSSLPPVPAWALALMGAVLAGLLGVIVNISLAVAAHPSAAHSEAHEAEAHAEHSSDTTGKEH